MLFINFYSPNLSIHGNEMCRFRMTTNSLGENSLKKNSKKKIGWMINDIKTYFVEFTKTESRYLKIQKKNRKNILYQDYHTQWLSQELCPIKMDNRPHILLVNVIGYLGLTNCVRFCWAYSIVWVITHHCISYTLDKMIRSLNKGIYSCITIILYKRKAKEYIKWGRKQWSVHNSLEGNYFLLCHMSVMLWYQSLVRP